jgi:hypothetical protein
MGDGRATLVEQVLDLAPEALHLLWQPHAGRDGLARLLSQLSLADLRAVLAALEVLCRATPPFDARGELAPADE